MVSDAQLNCWPSRNRREDFSYLDYPHLAYGNGPSHYGLMNRGRMSARSSKGRYPHTTNHYNLPELDRRHGEYGMPTYGWDSPYSYSVPLRNDLHHYRRNGWLHHSIGPESPRTMPFEFSGPHALDSPIIEETYQRHDDDSVHQDAYSSIAVDPHPTGHGQYGCGYCDDITPLDENVNLKPGDLPMGGTDSTFQNHEESDSTSKINEVGGSDTEIEEERPEDTVFSTARERLKREIIKELTGDGRGMEGEGSIIKEIIRETVIPWVRKYLQRELTRPRPTTSHYGRFHPRSNPRVRASRPSIFRFPSYTGTNRTNASPRRGKFAFYQHVTSPVSEYGSSLPETFEYEGDMPFIQDESFRRAKAEDGEKAWQKYETAWEAIQQPVGLSQIPWPSSSLQCSDLCHQFSDYPGPHKLDCFVRWNTMQFFIRPFQNLHLFAEPPPGSVIVNDRSCFKVEGRLDEDEMERFRKRVKRDSRHWHPDSMGNFFVDKPEKLQGDDKVMISAVWQAVNDLLKFFK